MDSVVAVTGAAGFIGEALCRYLGNRGIAVRALVRKKPRESRTCFAVGEVGPETDWIDALQGVDCVIHCAGRAHVLKETSSDPLGEFLTVNRDGTLRLATQAAVAGVKRLVFLSSVGVMGLHTNSRAPFTAFDRASPVWDYAISKLEAERGLASQVKETGLEVVIVRPSMVYGPEVPANFLRLLRIVDKGLPLPFASVANNRSMVYIDNLLDLLTCCVLHPAAAGEIFMVSDGCDVSTPDLVRKIARLMGRPARMVPFPVPLLRVAGGLLGRNHDIERLVGSLQVDIQHTCQTLGWSPPISLETGLRETVSWYLASRLPA